MGPPKNAVRSISQEAFDELVKENIDDLGMEPAEALQDAIETLTLQGVDLSGIVTCVPGEGSVKDNPVIQCLDRLKEFDGGSEDWNSDSIAELFEKLAELCSVEGSGNAVIATRNRALELVFSVCSKIKIEDGQALVSALKAMAALLHDLQSTETFRTVGGPSILMGFLNDGSQKLDILNSGFAVVAAAVTGNEVLKESFMELKIDELILQTLHKLNKGSTQSLYDAIRVLLTADDNRVVASQVYGYARKFAKIGIVGALVGSLQAELSSPSLVSASIALKAVAVNDEICKSIAENGGIDAVLRCIDESSEQGNKTVARVCCSLLSKLAGSDANKNAIVEKRGLDRLIKLSARFFDDPSVLQEIMAIISVLCLRLPENAARAIEAGAGDLAIQAMQKFPAVQQMQRNACFMIRNLVVRNPENRTFLLNNGVSKLIRQAKQNHESCKEAATDALRDLGLDDYNL
ncbi:Armadillo repeat-containing protein 6 [Morus notabilis]|uniref:Armadillo repeat-containing protein 6 n=1 Tax=Morus notabilis TaxID=981085 RepID=W9S903_9ROSA|nr:armadillo repeat-containing protein 6 isoform X1 [Morus notabilis]EXC17381.1 Armadillo repeat-containing protein 6 [Morus notabilis]